MYRNKFCWLHASARMPRPANPYAQGSQRNLRKARTSSHKSQENLSAIRRVFPGVEPLVPRCRTPCSSVPEKHPVQKVFGMGGWQDCWQLVSCHHCFCFWHKVTDDRSCRKYVAYRRLTLIFVIGIIKVWRQE